MIYPLDQQLEALMDSFVDEETGEITATEEEMNAAIEKVQMEFDDLIKFLRNSYLEDMLSAKCIYGEAGALYQEYKNSKKRGEARENRAERTKRFLAYLLNGEKFDKDGVRISYRKSEGLVIEDKENLIAWAIHNGPGFLKDPELREGDIKAAVKNGVDIPYVHIETRNNIQVK